MQRRDYARKENLSGLILPGVAASLLVLAGCATQAPVSTPAAKSEPAAATVPKVAALAAPTRPAMPLQELPAPSVAEVAAGIQVAHVGVTASGGLVDARFKILDAAKANALLADMANTPQLLSGDKPPLMAPHHALKGARFSNGQIIFILYPNTRGAVQAGSQVSAAFGATRLGPVTAQ